MIKLATMSSACPDWTLDEVVAGMKRHGYQGFEPRVEWDHACGIEAELAPQSGEKFAGGWRTRAWEFVVLRRVRGWLRPTRRSGPGTWRT